MKREFHIGLLALLMSASAGALAFEFKDATLEEAIEELEARGLSILYSSDLVKAEMRVLQAPTASLPRALLEEIVGPHGIEVIEGPAGNLVLTRAQRPQNVGTHHAESKLTEVVVTASRYAWVRVPHVSLTRLSDAELHLAPNVGDDPLRTLARLPGTATSDLSAKLNLRGGVNDEILVRFDGMRLMNPFHLKDFQSIFSAVSPALVGAIDLYAGGFPVNYGDRMSGVLEIHPVRAGADAYREIAVSLYNASAVAAGRFDRGHGDWAISARRGNLDRVLEWSGMELGDPIYSDAYGHLAHSIGDSMSLAANFLQFDDDIEFRDSDAEEQARARYRDRYLWVRLDAHPQAALTGSTLLARSDLESVRHGVADQPGISRGALDDRRAFTVYSLQTDWSLRASDAVTFELGAEWRNNEGHYRYRDVAEFDLLFDVHGEVTEPARAFDIDYRPRSDQYGAYAAINAHIAPPLTLEAGLRWDRSTLVDGDEHWSPRASALWRLSDSADLRASWGRFIQTQGIDELPASDGVAAFAPAQRADQWLVGIEKRFGDDLDLRLEAYSKHYFDLRPRYENILNDVVILPELKPDRVRLAPSQARAYGVELSVRRVRSRPLFWWGSYTWSRAEDSYHRHSVLRAWDQRHALQAGIGWEGERWEMSLVGAWRSGWPAVALDAESGTPIVHANLASGERLGTYIDVDVRIARRFRLGDDSSLTAFLEISNVLNRRNECCTEFELEDDSEEPVLVLESIRSLPLLPSLGVIWRF